MFEGDYTINGVHATYIKYLKDEVKAFERYIDVYMTGATMGVLHNRRAKQGGSTDRARIYADAFNTEHVKCNELFKLVILNDTSKRWSDEERINICFKYRDKMDDKAVPPIAEYEIEMMKDGYAIAIRDDLEEIIRNDAFKKHMKDILEYRTMDYYRRRYEGKAQLR